MEDACLQVMAQPTVSVPVPDREVTPVMETNKDATTIGEALQAAALTSAGHRPVDHVDAAAVPAAEARAMGFDGVLPGGVAAAVKRAAESNMKPVQARGGEEKKVTLRDVVGNASAVMPVNKVATWEDAMTVAAATGTSAGRGGSGMGEVADAVAAAAEMNDGRNCN